jgi:hypothetical protein
MTPGAEEDIRSGRQLGIGTPSPKAVLRIRKPGMRDQSRGKRRSALWSARQITRRGFAYAGGTRRNWKRFMPSALRHG